MAESIYLHGSEQVQRAASTMHDAAETMRNALAWHQETLASHERFLNEWLDRFEAVLKENLSTKHSGQEPIEEQGEL